MKEELSSADYLKNVFVKYKQEQVELQVKIRELDTSMIKTGNCDVQVSLYSDIYNKETLIPFLNFRSSSNFRSCVIRSSRERGWKLVCRELNSQGRSPISIFFFADFQQAYRSTIEFVARENLV